MGCSLTARYVSLCCVMSFNVFITTIQDPCPESSVFVAALHCLMCSLLRYGAVAQECQNCSLVWTICLVCVFLCRVTLFITAILQSCCTRMPKHCSSVWTISVVCDFCYVTLFNVFITVIQGRCCTRMPKSCFSESVWTMSSVCVFITVLRCLMCSLLWYRTLVLQVQFGQCWQTVSLCCEVTVLCRLCCTSCMILKNNRLAPLQLINRPRL